MPIFNSRIRQWRQGLTSAENSAKRLFKLLARQEKQKKIGERAAKYKIKLFSFHFSSFGILCGCFHSISCLCIWFIIFTIHILFVALSLFYLISDSFFCYLFFFFLRQSESCFPCYLLLPLSFVYSLRIPFPVLFVCPYVLCFKTKLKVREGRHLVRSSFRNYFCIQAYFWRFFVIYICLFFDMPDREISGQYASIPQSLRGRQGGMVIPQSSQDINWLIGLMDRAITRSFRCKSIKSNRFDRNH